MEANNVSINIQIYDLLLQSGPLSAEVISQILKKDKETVKDILNKLVQAGIVAKIDEERYIALPRISDLVSRVEEIKKRILEIRSDIESKFRMLESKVGISLDNVANVVKERLETSLNVLEKTLTDLINSYKQIIVNNVNILQEYSEILSKLSSSLKQSFEAIQTESDNIKKDLETIRSEFEEITKSDIGGILEKTDQTIKSMKESSMQIINEKISLFETQITEVASVISKSLSEIESSIKSVLESIDKILTEITESETKLFKEIEDKLKIEFESAPDTLLKSVVEIIDNKMSELDELLSSNREIIVARVNALISGSVEFMRELRTSLAEIVQSLEQAFGEASEIFVSNTQKRINDVYESYISKIDETKNNLIAGSQRLKELALSNIEAVKTIVSGALLNLRENIRKSVTEELLSKIRQIRDNINKLSEASQTIETGIRDTNMKYSQVLEQVIERMQEDINAFSKLFDEKMSSISNLISQLTTNFISEVNLENLAKDIGEGVLKTIKQYLERISFSLADVNKELLLELKLNIEKQFDEFKKSIEGLEIEQSIKNQLIDDISTAKAKLEDAIKIRIESVPQVIDARAKAFESALKEIIENTTQSQMRLIVDKVQSKLQESKVNLTNEVLWLKSEIQGRLKVLIEKRRAFGKDLINELSLERLKFFETINKDFEANLNEARKLIKDLREGLSAFRDKQISVVEAISEKLKNDIDSSFSSLVTTINNNINRINTIFKVLVENSTYVKNEVQKTVTSEFGTLTEKIRSEIDVELSKILGAVENYGKKIDTMIRDSLSAIDTAFNGLKGEINDSMSALKDSLSQAIKAFIERAYPTIINIIKEKQNEMLRLLGEHRENIQKILQEKITAINKLGGNIEADLGKLKEGTIQIFKDAEKPIEDLGISTMNQISEDLTQLENKINSVIADKFEAISKNYDTFANQVNMNIQNLKGLIENEVVPKYNENVRTLDESLQSFENSLKISTESIKAPIIRILEDLEKTLEKEKKSVKSVVDGSIRDLDEVFNDFLQVSEKLPDEIDRVLKKYIDALKARPKGLFIVYGIDVIATIMKDMAKRAKESLVIIAPVLDDTIKEIAEAASKNVLVEIFAPKILAKPAGHVFIFTTLGVPQNIFVASIDSSELIMVVNSREGKKIGIIFEGEPVKALLSTLVK